MVGNPETIPLATRILPLDSRIDGLCLRSQIIGNWLLGLRVISHLPRRAFIGKLWGAEMNRSGTNSA
jgi:hypothetical protein